MLLWLGLPPLLIHVADYVHECQGSLPEEQRWQRDLWLLEMFSGEAELTSSFRRQKLKSQWYDVAYRGPDNDFTSTTGFLIAIRDTLRLRPGALLWGGIPCCSYIWMSSSLHGRYGAILGDTRQQFVEIGNVCCARFAMLAALALVIGAHYCIEQPSSSQLVFMPYMQWLWFLKSKTETLFQRFWMANYDGWCMKPSWLCGSTPWIVNLTSKLDPQKKLAIKEKGTGADMVKKTISKSGRKVVSGGPKLSQSAAYPRKFAEWVTEQHVACAGDPPKLEVPHDFRYETAGPSPLRWEHANLKPLRDMLLRARDEGKFHPQPNLPL